MTDPRGTLVENYDAINPFAGYLAYTEGPDRSMSNAYATIAAVLAHLKAKLSLTGDCVSLGVTPVFKWSGLGDPNGLGFDGYGFTGTIVDHLPRITSTSGVHAGSIGIYGDYPGVHAIVALEDYNGLATKINSHGKPYVWQTTLGVENAVHLDQPLNWYAIAGLLPAAPKSYHFDRFDSTHIDSLKTSERAAIEAYIKYKAHSVLYAVQLRKLHPTLVALYTRVVNNSRIPPGPDADYRNWREQILSFAVANKVIHPS